MEIPSLTDRQIQILKCIIEEYIESGEAVGSETLDRKYNLGISPATIRNEMVILAQQGFLEQLHTSSGRIPTPMSLKFYIKQLMKEKDLTVKEEVEVKSKIWDHREEANDLLRQAVKILASKADGIAVAMTDHGDVFHAGYARLLNIPEFYDIDVTRTVYSLLDDSDQLRMIFSLSQGDDPIHILLGDDFNNEFLSPCGVIYTSFPLGSYANASLGVIGPSRFDYPYLIPFMRYFSDLIINISKDWE
jgi:heat-inducible transcriptional repressor